jgi:hypothetical protein
MNVKPYRVVAFAHSGFALINALELIHSVGAEPDDTLIVCVPRPERIAEMERVIARYPPSNTTRPYPFGWVHDLPRQIRGPIGRAERYAFPLAALAQNPRLARTTDLLALGLVPTSIMSRVTRVVRHRQVIAYDEGTTALLWCRNYPAMKWFTAYDLPRDRVWRDNTYCLTRNLLRDCAPVDEAWFIGHPLADRNRTLPEERYLALIERAAVGVKGLRYYPHPREPESMLQQIRDRGFQVEASEPPVELHPLTRGVPRLVAGCLSAAVTNFRRIYGADVDCRLFTTPELRHGMFDEWYAASEAMGVSVDVVD